jgi:hypothetical protein
MKDFMGPLSMDRLPQEPLAQRAQRG